MIEKSSITLSVKSLVRRHQRGEVRFDNVIQRNEVWDKNRKSMFIHSLMMNYPIPPVFAQDCEEGYLSIMDGKQRMTTVIRYVNDEFALDANTPPITTPEGEIDVANKKFSELPELLQDAIKDFDFLVYKLKGMTEDERDEMFVRMNMGLPLTKMELTRAIASGSIMEFVNEVVNTPFFKKSINLTTTAYKRFVDNEIVLQILAMIHAGGPTSLAGKDIQEFAKKLKENGLDDSIKQLVLNTAKYLGEAIPEKRKELLKLHVPMIFMMGIKAYQDGIDPKKFGGWVLGFFGRYKNRDSHDHLRAYQSATKEGSAQVAKVAKRYETMLYDYNTYIADAPDYQWLNPPVEEDSSENDEEGEKVVHSDSAAD